MEVSECGGEWMWERHLHGRVGPLKLSVVEEVGPAVEASSNDLTPVVYSVFSKGS